MNVDSFTPVGMLLINTQFDLPMYAWTKTVLDYRLSYSSLEKVSQFMDQGMCFWFLANDGWKLGHEAAHESMSEVPRKELYNETWQVEAAGNCWAGFDDLTIAEVASKRDIDVSPGLKKLWLTSTNMLHHKPKNFHLYLASAGADTLLLHSGLWAHAYAENAKRAGINYTVYYGDYPGMTASSLGPAETRHADGTKFNYHSSSTWHDEVIDRDKALHPAGWQAAPIIPNSLTEHVAFACYVTGSSCPLPAQPDLRGVEADNARGSVSTRLFDGKNGEQ